jgi:hypothetical protein
MPIIKIRSAAIGKIRKARAIDIAEMQKDPEQRASQYQRRVEDIFTILPDRMGTWQNQLRY